MFFRLFDYHFLIVLDINTLAGLVHLHTLDVVNRGIIGSYSDIDDAGGFLWSKRLVEGIDQHHIADLHVPTTYDVEVEQGVALGKRFAGE